RPDRLLAPVLGRPGAGYLGRGAGCEQDGMGAAPHATVGGSRRVGSIALEGDRLPTVTDRAGGFGARCHGEVHRQLLGVVSTASRLAADHVDGRVSVSSAPRP